MVFPLFRYVDKCSSSVPDDRKNKAKPHYCPSHESLTAKPNDVSIYQNNKSRDKTIYIM